MPQFVLLLHDAGSFDPNMSPDQMQAIVQRYVAWRAKVQAERPLGRRATSCTTARAA